VSAPSLPEVLACVQAVGGILDFPGQFACYDGADSRNASLPFARLLAWNQDAAAAPLPSGAGQRGLLVSLQGAW
jgi:hypothetical protein